MSRFFSLPTAMLAGCALAIAAPASALADDIAINASPDPVEDVAYQISVSGSSSSEQQALGKIKATGGRPCGANYSADDGVDIGLSGPDANGPFSDVTNRTTYDSGTYLLCAWLSTLSSSTPTAVAQQIVTVRAPRSSASVLVPARVRAGATFQVAVTAQTEVSRDLFVDVNSPGIACGANVEANREWDTALFGYANTGGPFTYAANVTAPTDAPGVYSVCGYVQENSYDAAPEATFSSAFTVISSSCRPARQARARYSRRVRQLERKLRQAEKRTAKRRYRGDLRVAKRKLAKAKRRVIQHCR